MSINMLALYIGLPGTLLILMVIVCVIYCRTKQATKPAEGVLDMIKSDRQPFEAENRIKDNFQLDD